MQHHWVLGLCNNGASFCLGAPCLIDYECDHRNAIAEERPHADIRIPCISVQALHVALKPQFAMPTVAQTSGLAVPPAARWQHAASWAAAALAGVAIATTPLCSHADTLPAAKFTSSCAGCHVGGGNIVKREATLSLDDLRKYGVDSPDALYSIIYSGRGSMPGYGKDCAPKGACTFGPRLADEEVKGLAEYVLQQAAQGWPS